MARIVVLCAALAGCSGRASNAMPTATSLARSFRMPTFAELVRFLPGGVPASGIPLQAPLLCGGTAKSVRLGTTAIKVPRTLLALSVSEYKFTSNAAADSFISAVKTLHGRVGAGGHYCDLPVAKSGDFYPGSGAYRTNDGYYLALAATEYGRGTYQGSYSYTSIAYVINRDVVFVIRVDRQNGYPDPAFMNVLLGAFETPSGRGLSPGDHSANPTTVTAILRPARYSQPLGGPNAAVTDAECPQAVIGGAAYNIVFERQLPNPQPAGLVIPAGATGGASTTIRWGAKVRLSVDTFGHTQTEPYFPCRDGVSVDDNYVNIISMAPLK